MPKEYTPISVCREFAVIEFEGMFLSQRVTWRADIRTLKYHCRVNDISCDAVQQFIEIPPDQVNMEADKITITLGLNRPLINHATLLAAIALIRQYKKLKPGVHRYGEIVNLT